MNQATVSIPSQITPQIGQRWRDRDPRQGGRIVTITQILCGGYVRAKALPYGPSVRIRTDRLRPIGGTKGFELVVNQ